MDALPFRNYYMNMKTFLLILLLPLLITAAYASAPPPGEHVLNYTLDVSFDVKASMIRGVARIPVLKGRELKLHRGRLTLARVTLDKEEIPVSTRQEVVTILPSRSGTLEIGYEGVFKRGISHGEQPSDVISDKGIFLTGTWYPKTNRMCRYHLTCTLPKGYEAVSEAETIEKTRKETVTIFRFVFPHPVDDINFIASDRYRIGKEQFGDVEIFAYFFREDEDLIKTYLEQTKRYLHLYRTRVGKFPYKRFSIVENFLPTGYSMPTYTLLGQQVVRLPFIPETSLGHEILHQWFGNLVYIDYEKGNWAEGLTTFLADHLYEEEKGHGPEYRKNVLIGYMSYVNEKNEFPLRDFRVKTDQASEAIGYGKAVMLFLMLKTMVGEERFYQSIRYFAGDMRYRKASWENIRRAFEKYYQKDLTWFFTQWVDGKGLPEVRLEKAEVKSNGNNYTVSFELAQGKKPLVLDIPVAIYSSAGSTKKVLRLSGEKERFEMSVSGLPERIVVDENYGLARRLSLNEFPPVVGKSVV